MSFLDKVKIINNENTIKATPSQAVDIYNNQSTLNKPVSFYMENPNEFTIENKQNQSNRLMRDIDNFLGVGKAASYPDLHKICVEHQENLKLQEEALVQRQQKERQKEYEESWWGNKLYQQTKKSLLSMEISELEAKLHKSSTGEKPLTVLEFNNINHELENKRKELASMPVETSSFLQTGSSIVASGIEFAPQMILGAGVTLVSGGLGAPAFVASALGGSASAIGVYNKSKDIMFSEAAALVDELNPNLDAQTRAETIDVLTTGSALIESLGFNLGLGGLSKAATVGLIKPIISKYGTKVASELIKKPSFKVAITKTLGELAVSSAGEIGEEISQMSLLENVKPIIERGEELNTAQALLESYKGLLESFKRISDGNATDFDKSLITTIQDVGLWSLIFGSAIKGGEASIQKIQEISTNKAKAQANLKKTQDFKKARDNNKLKAESPEADKAILKSILEANKLDGHIYIANSVIENLINESPNSEVFANAVNKLNLVEALKNSVDGTVAIELIDSIDEIFDSDGELYQVLEKHITWSPDSMSPAMFDIYTDALAGGIEDADKQFIDEIAAKLEPTSTPSRARGDALLAYYIADALSRADSRKTREQYGRELVDSVSVGDIKSVDELFVKDIEKPQTPIQKVVRKAKKAVGKVKDKLVKTDVEETIETLSASDIEEIKGATLEEVKEIPDSDFVRVGGKKMPVEYEVVELDSVQTSNDELGNINENYPQFLQNRDRSRKELLKQINTISENIEPERLGKNVVATEGAPIVTQDGNVAVGNGRVLALKMAYNSDKAQGYKDYLSSLGYNVDGFNKPVLIRKMKESYSDETMRKFIEEANVAGTSQMSVTEEALGDSSKLSVETLSLIDNEYDLEQAANRDFVKKAFNEIVPDVEQGRYLDDDNIITSAGIKRIKNAMLARVLPDSRILSSILESEDEVIRKVSNALLESAYSIVSFEKEIQQGNIKPEYSILSDIQTAFTVYNAAKKSGKPVKTYLKNLDLFKDAVTPSQATFIDMFLSLKNSGEIKNKIKDYISKATIEGSTTQENLFGDVKSKEELLGGKKLYQKLFQRGFAGSRVDYDKPSLEAMGTGEGAQVHGWGLYYALNRDVAERYRETFLLGKEDEDMVEYKGKRLSEFLTIPNSLTSAILYQEGYVTRKKVKEIIERNKSYLERDMVADEDIDVYKNELKILEEIDKELYSKSVADVFDFNRGQVHEVELPENPYLLDEQLPFNEQPEIVKKALEDIFNNVSDKYQNKNDVLRQYKKSNGRRLYLLVAEVAYFNKYGTLDGVVKLENRADKLASELLNKHGVKGITYEGQQDGRCFVIFNDKDVKVIQKFYQSLDTDIQGEFDVQTLAIRLSKHRNPTTFAHELCHYFTRKLEIAYKDGVLQDYWLKRYRDVMKFAGAKYNKQTKEYYFSTEEDWRKGNEKIANAFTEYLLQGKAPIKQLQPFFQKLKGWFKTVYETIKNFPRVRLSKPIIRVFDSIFAKEIEVETLMRAERLGTFERPDNVTDVQWEEYLTSKETARGASTSASIKAMEELAKKQSEESYQEQKAKFFTEELRELQQNPQHIARDIVGQLKINKASIDGLTTDVKLNSKFLTENGGLDARMVMEQYGFSSITEMVDFINNTNNTQTIAEQIATEKADAWVVEQYPELLDISAENAVRNIALIKTQVYESMMLQGIPLERFNMYYDEMILSTEKIIQGMKMNEVMNMTRWQNRMLNLNEKIITAQRKGNNKEAGKLRWRSAILNYVMLRSKNITGGYKRFEKKFDRYKYTPTKNQVKRIEGKVWDMIHSVLYNFGFTQRQPLDTTNVAQRITDYINDLQSKNFNVLDLTKEQAYFLTNPNATRPQDLKVEDFYAIDGSLRMLESASKKNMKYIQDEKIIEFDEDVSDIINHYEEKGISKWNKEDWGKNMVLGHWGMKETLLSRILPERIFLKYVAPFMDGLVNAAKFIDNKGKEIIEIIKPIMQKRKQEYTINGKVFTYEELGVIMANMGNEHNIDCIAETYGVTTQEIIDIADKAPKELRDIAQALWDMFEENSKLFKETVERITGIPLKMVEAKPITFSDGQTLRGGYYPANRKANTEAKDFLDETSLKSDEMFPMYSFTKQRTQLVHGDLDTTFKTLESWLYKMAMTIEVAESYNNLSKLAHSSRIVEVMGEGAKDEITNWMSQATTPEKVNKCVATFDALASVGILGWNPIKAVVQMTGIIPAMKEIGAVRCLTELVKIIANPYNILTIVKQAKGLSNYMNQRFSNPEMHLADVRRMNWLDGGKTKIGLEWVSHIGMAFVTYGDCIASVSSWRAMYNKALSEGKTEAEATSLADSVVRRVQGDTSAGSRPPLLQGDKRFFNKFASYFIGINSMIASDILAKRRVSAVAMFAMAGILAPTIEVLLSYVYEWETADEEKRKKWRRKGINSAEDYLQDKIKSQISTSVGSSIVPAYGVGFTIGQYLNIDKVYPADVIGLTNLRELATVPVDVLRQDYEKGFKKTITGLTPIGEDEYKRILEKLSRR